MCVGEGSSLPLPSCPLLPLQLSTDISAAVEKRRTVICAVRLLWPRLTGLRAGSVSDAHEADIFNEPQSVRLQEAGRRLARTVLQTRRQVHRLPTGLTTVDLRSNHDVIFRVIHYADPPPYDLKIVRDGVRLTHWLQSLRVYLSHACCQPGNRWFDEAHEYSAGLPRWWYPLHLPTEGWPGWVDMAGWLHTETVHRSADGHPSQY